MTLKKMNERSPKETIKVAGNQKRTLPFTRNLEKKSPLPIPGVPIKTTEKSETILTSFNQVFESPPYDDQPILPQGRQAKGGNTKDKRDLSKGWQRTTTFQKQATIFKKVKQKEEEPASPKHFLFIEGSPNQIGSLE